MDQEKDKQVWIMLTRLKQILVADNSDIQWRKTM